MIIKKQGITCSLVLNTILILFLASFSKNDGYYNNNNVYINKKFETKLKIMGFDGHEIMNLTFAKANKLHNFCNSKTFKVTFDNTSIKKEITPIDGENAVDGISIASYASYDDSIGNLGMFFVKTNVSLPFAASHHYDVLSISFVDLNEIKYNKINGSYLPDIEYNFRYDEIYYRQVVAEPKIEKTKNFDFQLNPQNNDKYFVGRNYVSVEFKLPTNIVNNLDGYGVNVEQYSYRNFYMSLETYFYPKITKPSTIKFLSGFVHDDSVLSPKSREVLDRLTLSINSPYFSFGKTLSQKHFEKLKKILLVLPFENI